MKEEKHKIDYERYLFSRKEKVRYILTGIALGTGIVWLVYHRMAAMPLAGVCAAVYLLLTARRLTVERRKTLQYHFRDFLSSLHTSLAAGYSMENAVRSADFPVRISSLVVLTSTVLMSSFPFR